MSIQPRASWVRPLAGLCSRVKFVPSTFFLFHSLFLDKSYYILNLGNVREQSIPCNSAIISKHGTLYFGMFRVARFVSYLRFLLICWSNLCMVKCSRELDCSHCHTRKREWGAKPWTQYSLHWLLCNCVIELHKGFFFQNLVMIFIYVQCSCKNLRHYSKNLPIKWKFILIGEVTMKINSCSTTIAYKVWEKWSLDGPNRWGLNLLLKWGLHFHYGHASHQCNESHSRTKLS